MYINKYIECVDEEIDKILRKESHGLTKNGEEELHLLLENRKHIVEYKEVLREKNALELD